MILSLAIAAIVAVLLWLLADEPIDTDIRVVGKVVECEASYKSAPRWCAVRLQDDQRLVRAKVQFVEKGETVHLVLRRRPISGKEFYASAAP